MKKLSEIRIESAAEIAEAWANDRVFGGILTVASIGFDCGAKAVMEQMGTMAHALKILRNETKGTLSAHEIAIRYDSGNSNWTCLEIALKQAEAALASWQEFTEERGGEE